jgi:hypothetical protein
LKIDVGVQSSRDLLERFILFHEQRAYIVEFLNTDSAAARGTLDEVKAIRRTCYFGFLDLETRAAAFDAGCVGHCPSDTEFYVVSYEVCTLFATPQNAHVARSWSARQILRAVDLDASDEQTFLSPQDDATA